MPTRTIFFHISPAGQAVFYLLAALSVAVCFWGFYRRVRMWRQGTPVPPIMDWPKRLKTLLEQVLAHRRVRRRNYAGKMHLGLFFGFLLLFIGTCIVAVEHYGASLFGDHWLYRGAFYLICKVTLDLAGLALLMGTGMALGRRLLARPPSLGHELKDTAFLLLLLTATLTGFLLEGAGIAADSSRAPYAVFSPVGSTFSVAMPGLSVAGYVFIWWFHAFLVLGVIAALPYGRWLHLFVTPLAIVGQPERPMGALAPIRLEQVEETGRIGWGTVADIDRWTLMSLDGCMECGRCTDVCPANAVGKELNPKNIVLDLRRVMATGSPLPPTPSPHSGRGGVDDRSESPLSLPGRGGGGEGESAPFAPASPSTDIISDASLWACTNCHACVRECPALIRHVDIINGIRRFRVAEGRLSGTAATTLRQLTSQENPWGLPASQRLDWAKGLEVPTAALDDGREVLLWVGCAGAFEPRAQKTTRAFVELLAKAGVRFAVLGPKERCTGDPARRIGDELLFQQLAETNVATLNGVGAKKIVTPCPHCFHTLKNEYPPFGGQYEVMHHTQFLAELLDSGRLVLPKNFADTVTYHDPCFLARVNNETRAPRKLLNGVMTRPLQEVERRKCKTFCCGAGGGRMWMEEPPNQRPGVHRAQELLATGAKTVAVGCPFCKVMIGDCVAQVGGESAPPVRDVAEVIVERVL